MWTAKRGKVTGTVSPPTPFAFRARVHVTINADTAPTPQRLRREAEEAARIGDLQAQVRVPGHAATAISPGMSLGFGTRGAEVPPQGCGRRGAQPPLGWIGRGLARQEGRFAGSVRFFERVTAEWRSRSRGRRVVTSQGRKGGV